jgi:hypothetical protein
MRLVMITTGQRARRLALVMGAVLVGAANVVAALADDSTPQTCAPTQTTVERLALQWFDRMRTGQIDRTQLTPDYSAQLTDGIVQDMSKYLKDHDYGSPPLGAQVIKSRTIGEQTFYVVKLVFPRGDAASLLFGFNANGKITGISIMSMAGD